MERWFYFEVICEDRSNWLYANIPGNRGLGASLFQTFSGFVAWIPEVLCDERATGVTLWITIATVNAKLLENLNPVCTWWARFLLRVSRMFDSLMTGMDDKTRAQEHLAPTLPVIPSAMDSPDKPLSQEC